MGDTEPSLDVRRYMENENELGRSSRMQTLHAAQLGPGAGCETSEAGVLRDCHVHASATEPKLHPPTPEVDWGFSRGVGPQGSVPGVFLASPTNSQFIFL